MSYIEKTVCDNEKLLQRAHLHWIYAFEGFVWLIILSAMGFLAQFLLLNLPGAYNSDFSIDLWIVSFDEQHTPFPWIGIATGLAVFLPLLFEHVSTEIGLTTQRILYKKGLFFVSIEERDLDEIRAEKIVHGWLGWTLGYGKIHLDCKLVDDLDLPAIHNPYKFLKESHKARVQRPELNYTQKDLDLNLEDIERRKREADEKQKLRRLGMLINKHFTRASHD